MVAIVDRVVYLDVARSHKWSVPVIIIIIVIVVVVVVNLHTYVINTILTDRPIVTPKCPVGRQGLMSQRPLTGVTLLLGNLAARLMELRS